jgi:glycosyltransferase involved in cell wall biosynthesis
MKVLVISAVFPPDAKGGAELGAYNCAHWLRQKGHDVGVLTTAATPQEELSGQWMDNLKVWRAWRRRPYARVASDDASALKKMVWHLQDHLDPANVSLMKGVISAFKPDVALVHLIPGIGHNSLKALNIAGVPVVYYLHDLGIACFRGSMQKKGQNCLKQCAICRLSSANTRRFFYKSSHYSFVATSAFTLSAIDSLVGVSSFVSEVLPDLDLDCPLPRIQRALEEPVQFLYVGRLHSNKGISFLMSVVDSLAVYRGRFHLTVVGAGPLERALRQACAGSSSVTFVGRVAPDQVKHYMRRADILCVPSTWQENHPGVIRQALRAGVPVIASSVGGMPEMIKQGETGILLPGADHASWKHTLSVVIENPEYLAALQQSAATQMSSYSVEVLGRKLEIFLIDAIKRASHAGRTLEETNV